MSIRFGTSGWRAIIADEFTFDNVRRVTEAICGYLTTEQPAKGQTLIIGCDSRFMGEKFSAVAAEIAATKGFRVLLCTGQTPTPAISYAIRSLKASGALNFTASHNPPEYQGIKFSTSDGAPALPEVTQQIEASIESGDKSAANTGGTIEEYDVRPDYLKDLAAKINLKAISESKGHFAYDALWGTGRGYLDKILRDAGCEVETINDWRDVTSEDDRRNPAKIT
jgi:phosphoglucomutase